MIFQVADIPRILPEILLLVLALLVLGSDIFEKWAGDAEAQRERARAAGSLTAIGLLLILVITLIQSGYVYRLPVDAPFNFLTNILRNLQAGGPTGDPIVGAFATDHLTMVARLTFIAAALLTTLLALDYQPAGNPGEFYALILFSTTGMCLMAAANELIIAYLAVELTSIPLYVLAGYFVNDRRSTEAGLKYFLFGALSSAVLLYGMSLTYGFALNAIAAGTGINANDTTQFNRIAELAAQAEANRSLLTLGMLLVVAGLGYKVAVVPFHAWSPDVYQGAPTPITAFISTASKAAGFILLFRVLATAFPELTGSASLVAGFADFGGWTSLLALLALLTLLLGNLAALPQTNARRLLAYSSIAQAGFLVMGLLAWSSPLAIDRTLGSSALLYYLFVYTVTNMGAFGVLAVVLLHVGGDDIADLHGLVQRNMFLAVVMAICVLSLAGIPPLAGFFAKFYIFMAAWQGGARWLVVVGLLTTIVGLYYYLRLLRAMFILPPANASPIPAPRSITTALVVSAVLVVALGIFPNLVLRIFERVQLVAGV